ncbi:phosphomevalonate kinase [Candidatus Uabimicrobium amorphum]|uniref:phosphomevalonate kinase n=2 Tax=Uabimicrobium amorphum TaxID=2596890 RepID=A0A5S9IMR1_UABAM|nr:phosphomevalonate kinase [Candidatus Uabimicrobium amorphum]
MLSGEWCVLEEGLPCIVMSVNAGISIFITPQDEYTFAAPDFQIHTTRFSYDDGNIVWRDSLNDIQQAQLHLCCKTMGITLQYLQSKNIDLRHFSLTTSSKQTIVEKDNGKKYKIGLGSSAAIAVGVVAAIFQLHDLDIEQAQNKKVMFNIACIAHYLVQEKLGSGFDIAASVWGGVTYYKRFSPQWLTEEMQRHGVVSVLDKDWPGLYCENLSFPENLRLLVGFVGYSANTKKLIRSLYEFRDKNPQKYLDKMREISVVVDSIKGSLLSPNTDELLGLITKNRYLLRDMNQFSYRKLETKELAFLADIAEEYEAAGKFSGAGAGDCGIAIVPKEKDSERILKKWQQYGIIPIDLSLSRRGAHVVTHGP